jgi:hypothetical protein
MTVKQQPIQERYEEELYLLAQKYDALGKIHLDKTCTKPLQVRIIVL